MIVGRNQRRQIKNKNKNPQKQTHTMKKLQIRLACLLVICAIAPYVYGQCVTQVSCTSSWVGSSNPNIICVGDGNPANPGNGGPGEAAYWYPSEASRGDLWSIYPPFDMGAGCGSSIAYMCQ